MKQKILAILCILSLILCAVGCGSAEGETTTVTGMVVSVDGTVISLMKTDGKMQGGFSGERPTGEMPEGFDPENMPEGFGGKFDPENMPEGFDPENMPEGMERPENGERPERPTGEEAQRPTGEMPDFQGMGENVETESIDLKNAHISVEIEDGKASGSMEDIQAGSFVTLTLNAKGEVTNVLVSSTQGFGNRGQGSGLGFGKRGQGSGDSQKSQNEDNAQSAGRTTN